MVQYSDEALAASNSLSKRVQRGITVIGNKDDTDAAIGWAGHNVLRVDDLEWSAKMNIRWLDSAIRRGDEIYLATEPAYWRAINPSSFYFVELRYLESKGFTRVGDRMVRGN